MKNSTKIVISIITILVLGSVLFLAKTLFTVPTSNNLQRADSQLVDQCNQILNFKIFETTNGRDQFFTDCINGLVDLKEYDTTSAVTPEDVLKRAETFTAVLEEVNTGCFVDGECYVKASGKHITIVTGFKTGPVGKIIGGEGSISGLEKFIGKEIEVYAQKIADKTYSLYDSNDFYIKVK